MLGKYPEDKYEALLDEGELSHRRAEAEKRFSDLGSSDIKYLRKRMKSDTIFLAKVLGYELLDHKGLHGHLCKWLQETRDEQFRLILLPRGHYKTTIDTIVDSIQVALPNDDGVVEEYPWTLGPNVKILIVHETAEAAERMIVEITDAFLSNPFILALFPECVPSPRKQRINKKELELPRTQGHKEPTFDALGVGGAAQGRHYHLIKMDDLIGEDARESPTVMKKVISWFNNVNSLLTRPKIDHWDLIGTRWNLSDVYSHAMETYGVEKKRSLLTAIDSQKEKLSEGYLAAYVRGAEEEGEAIFPSEFTPKVLTILKKDRKVWASQYANNPLDDALVEFERLWLKFYNLTFTQDIVVFEGEKGKRVLKSTELDRLILCDPSVGERESNHPSGIMVTGTDRKNRIYILETVKKRLKPPELISTLFTLYTKWWPRLVSIESVNFSVVLNYWFMRECARLKLYPTVYPYQTKKRHKEARIRSLSPYFSAGQIWCLEGHYEFREEYERFGATDSENLHLLDALAQGPELWQPGQTREDYDRYAHIEQRVMDQRSAETGY